MKVCFVYKQVGRNALALQKKQLKHQKQVMQVNFIGHGLDPKNENTVGNILATSFEENKFDSFTGLVAFASYAGVKKLVPSINIAKKNIKN